MQDTGRKIQILYAGDDVQELTDTERELLLVAQTCSEEEWNRVIREKKSWPVLRVFSHLRENLVEWLPFTGKERVLEIGSGCGELSGLLAKKALEVTCVEPNTAYCKIHAARIRERDNVRILAGTLDLAEKKLEESYDRIFLVGALPRAAELVTRYPVKRSGRPFPMFGGVDPELALLRFAKRHLAPGGQIILAQENRLGMKYWAGCRDEYTGCYFTGLEGEQTQSRGRTFSRRELQELFRQTGGLSAQFYYPYPDHQFPLSIYSDAYLPKKGDLKDNFCNYDEERIQLFDEPKVYGTVIENQLYPEFANSFLVILGEAKEPLIYTKYSNERSRAFAVRTDILEAGTSAEKHRQVKKTALYPEGCAHVQNLLHWYEALTPLYEKTGWTVNACMSAAEKLKENPEAANPEKNSVFLEYVEGQTLEEALDEEIQNGQTERALGRLVNYLDQIRDLHTGEAFVTTDAFQKVFGACEGLENLSCAKVTNLDLVCANLILRETPVVLDYEWTFDFPVPGCYVLYRVIHYYVDTHPMRQVLPAAELYARYGITEFYRQIFERMEASFQTYITRECTPVRELYRDISPGNCRLDELLGGKLQIYFGIHGDISETNSVSCPIRDGNASLRVSIPSDCRFLRIDPCEKPGIVQFLSFAFDGEEVPVQCDRVEDGRIEGSWGYFSAEDPALLGVQIPRDAKEFSISVKVSRSTPAAVEKILQTFKEKDRLSEKAKLQAKQIEEMKNTKVWKLYQGCRNLVERKKT